MSPLYRIGDCELDAVRGVVRRGQTEYVLRQQVLQVLLLLIEHADRVVSKEELFREVWRDTAVTDDAVVQCVVEIRKAFGDDVKAPRFIRTVSKAGYRFLAEAVPVVPGPPADQSGEPSRPAQGSSVRLVAVGPFEGHSERPESTWLRHGLPDMLVTRLAQLNGVRVVGRQQFEALLDGSGAQTGDSFGRALAAANRGHADILILGSFTGLGDSLRVDVRLHETTTGALVASDELTVARPEEVPPGMDALAARLAATFSGGRPWPATRQR